MTVADAVRGGIRSTASPVRAIDAGCGWTCPGRLVSAATPDSRRATHSQLARYQRAPDATDGRWRCAQSALGRIPRTQPASPVSAARAASSAAARVSSQVTARPIGVPSAAAVTSVGPWPSTAIARIETGSPPARSSAVIARIAAHHAAGSCSTAPLAPSVTRG